MDDHFLCDISTRMAIDINLKKEAILKKAIKDLTGLDIDLESESKRMFKRILRVVDDKKEIYYFNDGSYDGVKVVTFEQIDSPLVFGGEMCFHASLSFKYY